MVVQPRRLTRKDLIKHRTSEAADSFVLGLSLGSSYHGVGGLVVGVVHADHVDGDLPQHVL